MLYIYALLCEAASGLTVTFIGRTNGRTYPPLALLNYTVSSIYRYYIYCCFCAGDLLLSDPALDLKPLKQIQQLLPLLGNTTSHLDKLLNFGSLVAAW